MPWLSATTTVERDLAEAYSDVLLEYLAQPGADAATVTAIEGHIASMAGTTDFFGTGHNQALYRAYMPDWSFHWGSTRPRVHVGNLVTRVLESPARRTRQQLGGIR